MDGNEKAFLKIAETHARYGTTAMLPTTLTSTKEEMLQTLAVYEDANRNNSKWLAISGHASGRPLFRHEPAGSTGSRDISGIPIRTNIKRYCPVLPVLNDGAPHRN